MALLKKVFRFYINSSTHVALAVYAFVRITELQFGLKYNEPLDYFLFYGTITGYNFVKYAGVAKLHHRSLTKNLKIVQIFSLICFLLMMFYAFQLSIKTLLILVPFAVLTLLYAVPFLSGFQKNLRSISYLKIIIVAIVWAGLTVLLPALDVKKNISLEIVLTSIQRFLLVVVLILPFDIRDVKYDAISLQTIPKKIGVKKTKKLGFVLLMVCMVIAFYISPNTNFKTSFIVVFLLLLLLLMKATQRQSKYYSSFWVEAIPVFWYFILLLLNSNKLLGFK